MHAIAAVLVAAVLVPASVRAASTVALTPDRAVLGLGEALHLSVGVDAEGPALGCFAFSIVFDPAVLRFDGATEGTLFTGAPEPTFFSVDVDPEGRPRASACVLGFGTSVGGPGELAALAFTVIGSGATAIALQDVVLRDVDRQEIADVTALVSIVVTGTTSTAALDPRASLRVTPNPAGSVVRFAVSGAPTDARYDVLDIVDVAGRRVRRLPWPGQDTVLHWDGRDASGLRVGAGLYFATLRGRDRELRSRFLRIDD